LGTIIMKIPCVVVSVLLVALGAVACDNGSGAANNNIAPARGGVPDDSVKPKPGAISGIPDDSIKPKSATISGVPDDSIKPKSATISGVRDDSIKPKPGTKAGAKPGSAPLP